MSDEKSARRDRPQRRASAADQGSSRQLPQADAELAALIEAVAAGDRGALKQLYDRFGARLFGIASRILRDPPLAEDALQEAFVKIWRNAGRFDRARGSAAGWVITIVRRAAFDLRPRAPPASPIDVADEQPQAEMLHPGLARALDALPENHRKALLLMYVYGLTHSELAEAMSAPLGTVKSWVRRGAAAVKEAVATLDDA